MVSNKVESAHRKIFFWLPIWNFMKILILTVTVIVSKINNKTTQLLKCFSHTMITDFWFRWSNVKLILSWDSRIIPNKNSQIRIDYFLNHTFKRNCLSEFREQIYEEYNRLIQRRRNLIHPLMFKNIGNYEQLEKRNLFTEWADQNGSQVMCVEL